MTEDKRLRIFNGAVAVITGGASGIGRALGKELARRGASVVLADKDSGQARLTADEINNTGGAASASDTDVTDPAAVERLVRETAGRHGRLDYMFNNAGIGVAGLMRDFTLEHWRKVINVNLFGVIHGIQAAYPFMLAQGFGHIVNTASVGGLAPFPLNGGYTASKFAVVGLTRALRVEAMDYNVRVSVVCPGVIRTPILDAHGDNEMLYKFTEEMKEKAWKRTFPADPDVFARRVLDQVAANRAIIVVPGWWKALWLLERLSPNLMHYLLKKKFYDVSMKDLAQFLPAAGEIPKR